MGYDQPTMFPIERSMRTRDKSLAALETETPLVVAFAGNASVERLGPVEDHPFFIDGVVHGFGTSMNSRTHSDPFVLTLRDMNVKYRQCNLRMEF